MNGQVLRLTLCVLPKLWVNGFPIGACLATAKAAQGMVVGTHGSQHMAVIL